MALKAGWGCGMDRKALYRWNLNVRAKEEQGREREEERYKKCVFIGGKGSS